jgi:hypothetical protein
MRVMRLVRLRRRMGQTLPWESGDLINDTQSGARNCEAG